MKASFCVTLMAGVVALLVTGVPLPASEMDDRIESSARNSYIFATYLIGDDIKIQSMDGVVTLTGMVSKESHKSMAQEILASKSVSGNTSSVVLVSCSARKSG